VVFVLGCIYVVFGLFLCFAVLASKDEDGEVVQEFGRGLRVEKVVEVFGGMVHGWMSAR